jgi:hypothetical protein
MKGLFLRENGRKRANMNGKWGVLGVFVTGYLL